MGADHENILELQNVSKSFPGVKALSDVNFSVRKGEIHSLVGENGAGKSTLIKILAGAYKRDTGRIWIDGKEVGHLHPKLAEQLGISIIYQELNLVHSLTIAENIFIGRLPKKNGIIQWKKVIHDARELMERLGIDMDPRAIVGSLSIAQQQMVEIAKAMSVQANLLIMDEPTSSLTTKEISILFSIIQKLKQMRVSVIFISHRMDEIFDISDRLTVLRDGRYIATRDIGDITRNELITLMTGREMANQYPHRESNIRNVLLEVKNLRGAKKIDDVSFTLRQGEVLGFAGLVGSGRTEVMRLLFGIDPIKSGTVLLKGREIHNFSPRRSIKSRIGYVTEDRKSEGLFLPFPIKTNVSVVAKEKIKRYGLLNMKLEQRTAEQYVQALSISAPSVHHKVISLSGGNQQKVVLAKWLLSDPEIIIMDEPTRGIDVGAKRDIYEIIGRLASEGKGIIMISSETEELIGVCDRIVVMFEGKNVGVIDKKDFSQKTIAEYMLRGRV